MTIESTGTSFFQQLVLVACYISPIGDATLAS